MPTPHSTLLGKLVKASGCPVVGCCPDLIGIVAHIDAHDSMVTLSNVESHHLYTEIHHIYEVWGDPDFQQLPEEIQ